MFPRAALTCLALFLALVLALPADGWARDRRSDSGRAGVRRGGSAHQGGKIRRGGSQRRGKVSRRGGGQRGGGHNRRGVRDRRGRHHRHGRHDRRVRHHRSGDHHRHGRLSLHGGYSFHLGYYGPFRPYSYYGHYPYAYGYGYGYYPGPYYSGPDYAVPAGFLGALDLNVKPKSTEVYVNGDYVGTTDNFDGFPRYLWLPEGSYEIIFYRDGFQTEVKRYGIYPGAVGKVRFRMEPGPSTPPEELTAFPLDAGPEIEGEYPPGP